MVLPLKRVGDGLSRAWQGLAAGWRELANRSSQALTRFVPRSDAGDRSARAVSRSPVWGLVAGDILETDRSVVVEVEIPGVDKADCEVEIDGRTLRVRGEKRVNRDHLADGYHLMERAYGVFERSIPLPPNADTAAAKATYRNGVLTVEFAKTKARRDGRLKVV